MMSSSPQPRLYIDTNIFLDHFLRRRGKSSTLLREIANGRFAGVTSHFTLSELTGVLKELRVPYADISRIIGQVQAFPNLQIVFHDQNMFLDMPQNIINTCVQCRDALHFMVAKSLAVDRIVTRDGGFKNAVDSVIQCVTPEQLIP
jgi:predicted nucleic acid-binding protein